MLPAYYATRSSCQASFQIGAGSFTQKNNIRHLAKLISFFFSVYSGTNVFFTLFQEHNCKFFREFLFTVSVIPKALVFLYQSIKQWHKCIRDFFFQYDQRINGLMANDQSSWWVKLTQCVLLVGKNRCVLRGHELIT